MITPILFRVEGSLCYVVAGERRCIAAKKQERAMLTACQAYRKSLKPAPRTPRTPLSKSERALQACEAAEQRIGALAARELTAAEREALDRLLNRLKGTIEELLTALSGPEGDDGETPGGVT